MSYVSLVPPPVGEESHQRHESEDEPITPDTGHRSNTQGEDDIKREVQLNP